MGPSDSRLSTKAGLSYICGKNRKQGQLGIRGSLRYASSILALESIPTPPRTSILTTLCCQCGNSSSKKHRNRWPETKLAIAYNDKRDHPRSLRREGLLP